MKTMPLILICLSIFALAYRYYALWISRRVLRCDAMRTTPAVELRDDKNYYPTDKKVMLGQHFAAIAAAGPLAGPVLAAQFGWLPGFLWIIVGCVLGGITHDMVVLFASMRNRGGSLVKIYENLNIAGGQKSFLISALLLAILILTLAGLSLVCVGAMTRAPVSLFVVGSTIPIAMIMGMIMKGDKKLHVATIIGAGLLVISMVVGIKFFPNCSLLSLDRKIVALLIASYGFIAAILPTWLLLTPRGYLSSFLKVGAIGSLICAVSFFNPTLQMPAVSEFITGGGPIIKGSAFPFLFITIACGAISGFHVSIAAGTTSKQCANETHIPLVAGGAMLFEGVVALLALLCACSLNPGDYFAINLPLDKWHEFVAAHPMLQANNIKDLSDMIGLNLVGRPGGAVSLAAGITYIFAKSSLMTMIAPYVYNFAIMFEAVFILTAIDAGTRSGRYLIEEICSAAKIKIKPVLSAAFFTLAWGYLCYSRDVSTIWPLFGVSNQLLASLALLICGIWVFKYVNFHFAKILAFLIPSFLLSATALTASFQQVVRHWAVKNFMLVNLLSIITIVSFVLLFKLWKNFIESYRKEI
jgi:carbon starvation protein